MRWCIRRSSNSQFDEWLFRILLNSLVILLGFIGNVPRDAMLIFQLNEEDIMKKLGYIIAALGTIAIAAPSIASAKEIVIRHGHDRLNARAEMHRDHGWHRHHNDRVVVIKHRRHDY
jgi:hypothetical protein